MRPYILGFAVGLAVSVFVDVRVASGAALRWLQHDVLAPFYQIANSQRR